MEDFRDLEIPAYSKDLIRLLDEAFSHRILFPSANDDMNTIQRNIGQRELVDTLLARLAEQEEIEKRGE